MYLIKTFYVSPESLKDVCSFASDIWACGVLFHLLLVGYPPFRGKTHQEICDKIRIGKFDLENEDFKEISIDAKNLLISLLEYDHNKRISAEQALSYKYFEEKSDDFKELNFGKRAKNLENFKV